MGKQKLKTNLTHMETDHSWRQEYLASKPRLSAFQKELLTNGPKGLSQAWILGAMHNEWKVQKYGILTHTGEIVK